MRSKKRATSERFTTARKGYDPGEVDIFVAATEHRVDELGAALASARTRVRSLEAEVQTYADREEEFTGPVRIAHQRADAIVAAAEQDDYDLVIVGSRGLGGVTRFLTGSVSSRVVTHAPCSVLVVR